MKKFTNDHRARVTRLLLRKAFMELLRKKSIQNISIKELCETAGVNRGTFYTHYTDIYDLRDQIEEEMLQDFEKSLEPIKQFGHERLTLVRITAAVFQCLKDNSDLCTVTLGDYGDKAFALKLVNLGREKCIAAYSKYFRDASPKKLEYYYAFVSSGCIGLLQKWLADGMTSSAEEMARIAEGIMMQGIKFLQN